MTYEQLVSKMTLWTELLSKGLTTIDSFVVATNFILAVYDRGKELNRV